MSTDFHELRIADIRQDTEDAVIVSFELPSSLRETYRFEPGQHLTLRALVEGSDLRRSYSICTFASNAPPRPDATTWVSQEAVASRRSFRYSNRYWRAIPTAALR